MSDSQPNLVLIDGRRGQPANALLVIDINTIPSVGEPEFPGDEAMERRIRAFVRWNAAVMVHRAQRPGVGVGGHISTFASSAALYEVGFKHFFKGNAIKTARLGNDARIGGVQAALVGQDHQRIAFDQVGDQGAKRIVVPEADFIGDHSVIFVDDRNDAEGKERHDGRFCIQVALPVS